VNVTRSAPAEEMVFSIYFQVDVVTYTTREVVFDMDIT
jgi:hypothetical protein